MLETVSRQIPKVACPTAIYDGDCRTCTGFAKMVSLLDTGHCLGLIPAQSPEAQRFFALEELKRTFHVVLPGGQTLVHGDALALVVGTFPGLAWLPILIHRSRRLRHFTNRLYGWLARNRSWINLFA